MFGITSIHPGEGSKRAELGRRTLDIAVSLTAITLLSPIFLLISIAILIDSGRPIFFLQHRIGRNGRPFRMCKFRKFRSTCGTDGSPLTLDNDDRSTNVGKILMATKLDELPQFWNVLKGDMAIIGPRPESFAFAECFTGSFMEVLEHKPGIMGPAQVVFRNESGLYAGQVDPSEFYRAVLFPMKAKIDLDYYRHRTLVSDVAWMFKGAAAILGFTSPFAITSPADKNVNDSHIASLRHKALRAAMPERSNL